MIGSITKQDVAILLGTIVLVWLLTMVSPMIFPIAICMAVIVWGWKTGRGKGWMSPQDASDSEGAADETE